MLVSGNGIQDVGMRDGDLLGDQPLSCVLDIAIRDGRGGRRLHCSNSSDHSRLALLPINNAYWPNLQTEWRT